MLLRVSASGNVQIDWGNGDVTDYSVATSSTTITGVLAKNIVKIYGDNLTYFECNEAGILDIDVSNASELLQLYCTKNELMELDVSCNAKLVRLGCSYNKLKTIDLRYNTKLTGIYLQYNLLDACALNDIYEQLPSRISNTGTYNFRNTGNPGVVKSNTAILTVKNWLPDVTGDDTGGVPVILTTTKNIGESFSIELRATSTSKVSIDWGGGKNIYEISVESTPVNEILVAGNTVKIYSDDINFIKCENNKLSSVDVSKAYALQQIYVGNNELTELDVSSNINLTRIGCDHNKITHIDLSQNQRLSGLYFQNNLFDACALNAIFNDIPALTTLNDAVNFRVLSNPGTLQSNTSLAVNKKWHIDSSGDNSGCFTSVISEREKNIIISPTVVVDFLYIKSDEAISQVTVYDTTGRIQNVIYNIDFVDMSGLSRGMYLLKIETAYQQQISKVLKK